MTSGGGKADVAQSGREAIQTFRLNNQFTLTTAGGFHDPSRIEGDASLGQYILSIGRKSPFGAGSQLASLSAPVNDPKFNLDGSLTLYFQNESRII
jgi:hypothetical protein